MYYGHFGLAQAPFRITPNTEFFFGGGNRGPILEALIYAISQGEGIIKVTGEVGSGKTMLCSMLQSRLPPHVETVYLANPSVSPDEILHAIALELHLQPAREAGHLEVMQMIHDHLLERHAQGKQVVMFVEESQSMPIATLEEIRLLSNLETANGKLLQIVLFGQPELEDNLRQPQIRQLRERITHSFKLSPLKPEEVRDYLNFRLRAAGYRGPDLFSTKIVNAIGRASEGLTRRINLIADKALLAAFSENTHTIRLKHVKAAVRDSEFSNYEPPQPRVKLGYALLLFALGTGLGIALLASFQAVRDDRAVVAPPAPATPPPGPASAERAAAPPTQPPAPAPAPRAETAVMKEAPSPESGPASVENTVRPDTTSVSAGSPTSAVDLVESRLAATKSWLARENKTTYSIQLMGADSPQQLKQHLNIISKYIEMNDIFVYRTIARQKPSLTVLYGAFGDRRSALEALEKLPVQLKVYRPMLRTVQGIRAEIASHQPS